VTESISQSAKAFSTARTRAFRERRLGGWPLGYESGRGMPGTLVCQKRPSRYGVITDQEVT